MRRFYYSIRKNLLHKKFRSEQDFFATYPALTITPEELEVTKSNLRESHTKYVTEISSPAMAGSLELSALLFLITQKHKPKKVLDLGSGYSTFVFNLIHNNVVSVDDSKEWLLKTEKFLQDQGLNKYKLLSIDEFLGLSENFDLVFVDLNFVEERIKYTKKILSLLSKNAIVIFDDVHKDDYLIGLVKELQTSHSYLFKRLTLDNFGRFSLLYVNA